MNKTVKTQVKPDDMRFAADWLDQFEAGGRQEYEVMSRMARWLRRQAREVEDRAISRRLNRPIEQVREWRRKIEGEEE